MKEWQVKFLGAAWTWWLAALPAASAWLANTRSGPPSLQSVAEWTAPGAFVVFLFTLTAAVRLAFSSHASRFRTAAFGFLVSLALMLALAVAAVAVGHSVGLF